MAAHRYWRATALEPYGGAGADLELSEFHLLAATTRVDAAAALAASAAPDVGGSLAALQDDVLTTSARWAGKAVKSLALQWDFGVGPVDVTDIRLAGDNNARFPLIVKIQWSDDAVAWTDALTIAGIAWPGRGAKTTSVSGLIATNFVKGRAAPFAPLAVISAAPPIVCGVVIPIPAVVRLGVAGGSVKDYITGVLGAGIGRVRSTVQEKGTPNTPVHRRVRLVRECDGLVLREQWSDPVTGAYDFQFVDELQTYTVLSYDHTRNFRAVIADGLTLANGTVELMP